MAQICLHHILFPLVCTQRKEMLDWQLSSRYIRGFEWVCCTMKECWTRWFRLVPRGLNSAGQWLRTSLVVTLQQTSANRHCLSSSDVNGSSVLLRQDAYNGCSERLYVRGERWEDPAGNRVGVRSHKTTMRLGDGSHFPLMFTSSYWSHNGDANFYLH